MMMELRLHLLVFRQKVEEVFEETILPADWILHLQKLILVEVVEVIFPLAVLLHQQVVQGHPHLTVYFCHLQVIFHRNRLPFTVYVLLHVSCSEMYERPQSMRGRCQRSRLISGRGGRYLLCCDSTGSSQSGKPANRERCGCIACD